MDWGALGRSDQDRGAGGVEGLGEEFEFKGGAAEGATALLGTLDAGVASGGEGTDRFIVDGDLHVEVFPEVVGAGREAGGELERVAMGRTMTLL